MKKKSNFFKWLNYKIDNYITRGVRAQFVLLTVAILLIVLIFGVIAGAVSSELSFKGAIWQSLLHIIDQGTIGGDEVTNLRYVFIMLLVTFLGMAFTGTIVGIINNAMTEKLDELKKGHSQIIEKGHVVIIGFDENVYTLLSEMEESNLNWTGNRKIVVVDDMPKEEMEHLVKEHDQEERKPNESKNKHKNNLIFRSGSIVSENTYEMASVEKARAIVINCEDDFTVIRVILALVAYLKKKNAYFDGTQNTENVEMPSIVSLMHEEENITAAEIAAGVEHGSSSRIGKSGESKVRVLYFEDILAHIFAQVCRQPGLSWVVSEIFDYENSEIYIESMKKGQISLDNDFDGKTFAEISEMMTNSIAIGIQHKAKDGSHDSVIDLNPDPTTVFNKGDKIIHLADDDNQIEITNDIDRDKLFVDVEKQPSEVQKYNILVFGWSVPLPEIIKDIDKYALNGGTVRILTRHQLDMQENINQLNYNPRRSKKAKRGVSDIEKELKNLKLIKEDPIDPYNFASVNKHLKKQGVWSDKDKLPTNILILCQDGIDKVEADEKAAVLLLNIRHFLHKKGLDDKINITTEMNLPENQELLQHTSVNDFIVGSEIANRMLIQVANNPDINSVFYELLNDKGSELYIREYGDYVVDINAEFSFKDIERVARSKNEVALGWIKYDEGSDHPEVKLNPQGIDRNGPFSNITSEGSIVKLVVLAKNEHNKEKPELSVTVFHIE